MKVARYWHPLEDDAVQCELCPHRCRIPSGGRSRCFGRVNHGGQLVAETWGWPVAVQVDPIEKKPLYHFLPGRWVFSLGTLGCNLSCRFCQNWSLSHPEKPRGGAPAPVSPEDVVQAAQRAGAPMVAATYNEPAVWAEYAMDIADACHAHGLKMVAVTSGYFTPQAGRDFFAKMDAANVDLKSMRDEFYREYCGTRLAPVLDTLKMIRQETTCWLEVTTLLIPGLNDSEAEVDELTAWVATNLGVDTPLHFSAFHPDGQMLDVPATPKAVLVRAREQARRNGLRHVYLGNIRVPDGGTTWCANCGAELIQRDGFQAQRVGMGADGRCWACGEACPGVW